MTIILNRPHVKNAIDTPTAQELAAAFKNFDSDPSAKVAVLYGRGGFCAGFDLKAVATSGTSLVDGKVQPGSRTNLLTPFDGADYPREDGPIGPTRMALSKPVIAAIEGYAVAGGMELAIWCDLRVMEEDAHMGILCRRWGVPLVDGGTVRLPRIVGLGRAMDLILTGRLVGAQEALHIGLATKLVAKGSAREQAEALAASLCQFPQECMRHDRLSAYESYDSSMGEAMANELRHGRVSAVYAAQGAARFAAGVGRGGSFELTEKPAAPARSKL